MTRARSELVDVLRGSVLFGGLTRQQLNAVAKACFERRYEPGDVIVQQNDQGQQMVALLSGSAKVVQDGRKIATVRAGDAVGEMSLIDGLPCSASVVADAAVEAVVLYRTAFAKLLVSIPTLTRRLLLTQTARVRELDKRAAALG